MNYESLGQSGFSIPDFAPSTQDQNKKTASYIKSRPDPYDFFKSKIGNFTHFLKSQGSELTQAQIKTMATQISPYFAFIESKSNVEAVAKSPSLKKEFGTFFVENPSKLYENLSYLLSDANRELEKIIQLKNYTAAPKPTELQPKTVVKSLPKNPESPPAIKPVTSPLPIQVAEPLVLLKKQELPKSTPPADPITQPNKEEIINYLEALRQSGKINYSEMNQEKIAVEKGYPNKTPYVPGHYNDEDLGPTSQETNEMVTMIDTSHSRSRSITPENFLPDRGTSFKTALQNTATEESSFIVDDTTEDDTTEIKPKKKTNLVPILGAITAAYLFLKG